MLVPAPADAAGGGAAAEAVAAGPADMTIQKQPPGLVFPATVDDLNQLGGPALTALLQAYNLPFQPAGPLSARLSTLKRHLCVGPH